MNKNAPVNARIRIVIASGPMTHHRISLSAGAPIAGTAAGVPVTSAAIGVFPLLLLGLMLLGVGSAVHLQARFAATDLSRPGVPRPRLLDRSVVHNDSLS